MILWTGDNHIILIKLSIVIICSVLAEEFHTNRDEYMRKARQLDREKARQISWEDYMKV